MTWTVDKAQRIIDAYLARRGFECHCEISGSSGPDREQNWQPLGNGRWFGNR
jgi:hypothetical protein